MTPLDVLRTSCDVELPAVGWISEVQPYGDGLAVLVRVGAQRGVILTTHGESIGGGRMTNEWDRDGGPIALEHESGRFWVSSAEPFDVADRHTSGDVLLELDERLSPISQTDIGRTDLLSVDDSRAATYAMGAVGVWDLTNMSLLGRADDVRESYEVGLILQGDWVVYAGSEPTHAGTLLVFAVDVDGLTERWRASIADPNDIAVADDITVASGSRGTSARRLSDGALVWTQEGWQPLKLAGLSDGAVLGVDRQQARMVTRDGSTRWNMTLPGGIEPTFLAAIDDRAVVIAAFDATHRPHLTVVDADTGEVLCTR